MNTYFNVEEQKVEITYLRCDIQPRRNDVETPYTHKLIQIQGSVLAFLGLKNFSQHLDLQDIESHIMLSASVDDENMMIFIYTNFSSKGLQQ